MSFQFKPQKFVPKTFSVRFSIFKIRTRYLAAANEKGKNDLKVTNWMGIDEDEPAEASVITFRFFQILQQFKSIIWFERIIYSMMRNLFSNLFLSRCYNQLTFKEILYRLTDVPPRNQVLVYSRHNSRLVRLNTPSHTLRSYGICHGDIIQFQEKNIRPKL